MGERSLIPGSNEDYLKVERMNFDVHCEQCGEPLRDEWLAENGERKKDLEQALRDLITIIELDELYPVPDLQLRLVAQENALKTAKSLLPGEYKDDELGALKQWQE